MQSKDLIGLAVIAGGISFGVLAACLSQRIRDVLFIAMLWLAPMTELYDVNFVSRDFYRGTVRGFEFSLVDVCSMSILLSAILAPRLGEKRMYLVPGLGVMLLFFFYCMFNVAIADPKLFGMFELSKMFRGLVIFLAVALYVRSERELRLAVILLAAIVCYQGYVALKQRYLWGMHRVPGTLEHSNSLAALMGITAPIFVAAFNSNWKWYVKVISVCALGAACVGMILTISRAGVVILAGGLLLAALLTMTYTISAKKVAIAGLAVLAAAGLFAKSWETLKERFRESNLEQEYSSARNQGRGYYLRLAYAIATDRVFGVGLNNWSYWVSNQYGPKLGYKFNPYKGTDREPNYVIPEHVTNIDDAQAAPAHNLGALTLGELGGPGLLLFALVWARWFQMGASFVWPRSRDPIRMVGIGILVGALCMWLQSITEWVFRHSPVFYVFHVMLGVMASLYYMKKMAKKQAREAEEESDEDWQETDPVATHDNPSDLQPA